MPRGDCCWPTRSARTPAASGTRRPARSWIRTASGTTWAVLKRPTLRYSGGSPRSRKGVRWIEGPRTRSSEEWHPRPAGRGRPPRPTGPGFRGRRQRPYRSPYRDGGRVRGRGRGHVPAPPREPDDRGVRVGGALLRIGVTIFPGSNCDRDALYAIELAGAEPVELWHADASLKGVDAVVVPGGFSYGDYLRPGAIARFSKVMGSLEEFATSGGPILGICNEALGSDKGLKVFESVLRFAGVGV